MKYQAENQNDIYENRLDQEIEGGNIVIKQQSCPEKLISSRSVKAK